MYEGGETNKSNRRGRDEIEKKRREKTSNREIKMIVERDRDAEALEPRKMRDLKKRLKKGRRKIKVIVEKRMN